MRAKPEFVVCPFLVLADNNEQLPYCFSGLHTDADQGNLPLLVRSQERSLETADYTIEGLEKNVAVERKSFEDLYHTLGQGRDRFERELERMHRMDYAAVVVEASWQKILKEPPAQLKPKSVYRSILAWSQRYYRVHWFMMEGRRLGEVTTFRILERFYRDHLVHDD